MNKEMSDLKTKLNNLKKVYPHMHVYYVATCVWYKVGQKKCCFKILIQP